MKNINRLPFPELIEQWLNLPSEAPKYVIGCDVGREVSVFCLGRHNHNGTFEILLQKQFMNEDLHVTVKTEFETEVDNLSKYFNAIIIKEE